MFLELSVQAVVSRVASFIVTLSRHHAIEATLATVVRNVIVLDSVVIQRAWNAQTRLYFIVFG